MKRILLGKNIDKYSTNTDNYLSIEVGSDFKNVPNEDIVQTLDAYNQYVKEADESNRYRLLFTINPICSNVLFNNITEIVYNEGSEGCVFFGEGASGITRGYDSNGNKLRVDSNNMPTSIGWGGIATYRSGGTYLEYTQRKGKFLNRYDMIRDTAYSHPSIGPVVYHCGYDIFNNHTFRRKNFIPVNLMSEDFRSGNTSACQKFNTIEDYARDYKGNIVKDRSAKIESINGWGPGVNPPQKKPSSGETDLHNYTYQDLYNYYDAVDVSLVDDNGWIGFINPSTLEIENCKTSGETVSINASINKCMNNNKYNEQIDMYPDRSLYYFIPKYNKYRKRMEYNWDYCLTYPYKNVYDNSLIQSQVKAKVESGQSAKYVNINALECLITTNIYSKENQGHSYSMGVTFRGLLKNNISPSDNIRLYIIRKKDKEYESVVCRVTDADATKNTFTVNSEDFIDELNKIYPYVASAYTIDEDTKYIVSLSKDCEFRFVRIDGSDEVSYYIRKFRKLPNFKDTLVYNDGVITEEEITKSGKTFSSSLTKVAFSRNSYGDPMAQIVYNDDIVTTGILDNLGREVSEIYLTILKRNKGYKDWYSEKPRYSGEDIEFSHCFGDLSSGFDLAGDIDDYNIRKIHSVDYDALVASGDSFVTLSAITPSPAKLESGITIESEDFCGDIVEFAKNSLTETVLEDVYHRFNTAQREAVLKEYENLYFDRVLYDDYDVFGSGLTIEKVNLGKYTVSKVQRNFHININPEGYFYKPHYKLHLYDFEDEVQQGQDTMIAFSVLNTDDMWSKTKYKKIRESYITSLASFRINFYDVINNGTTDTLFRELLDLSCDDKLTNVDMLIAEQYFMEYDYKEIEYRFKIRTAVNYYLEPGKTIDVYDKMTGKSTKAKIVGVSGSNYNIIELLCDTYISPLTVFLFKPNILKPSTAYNLNDGTGRYLWREKKSRALVTDADEISEQVFTNGAHYIHHYIPFFVRRQGDELSLANKDGLDTRIRKMTIDPEEREYTKFETAKTEDNQAQC